MAPRWALPPPGGSRPVAVLRERQLAARSIILGMEEFVVRPAHVSGQSLIEFLGDHRSDGYPKVLSLLERLLPGFQAQGNNPALDDLVWTCSFSTGRFELSDDWGGLFVIPLAEPEQVVSIVAEALERSGAFRRVAAKSGGEPGSHANE